LILSKKLINNFVQGDGIRLELDYIKILTKEHYEYWECVKGTVTGEYLENDLGSITNPLIILPARTVGAFVASSRKDTLNPYPLRLDINKYYFYHKYIDVLVVDLFHDDLKVNRFMIAERLPNTEDFTGRHMVYEIA
jgi:hypothetical protein